MTHKSSTQIPKQKNLDVNSLFFIVKKEYFPIYRVGSASVCHIAHWGAYHSL